MNAIALYTSHSLLIQLALCVYYRRAHVQQGLSNWLCLSVVRPLSVQKKKIEIP